MEVSTAAFRARRMARTESGQRPASRPPPPRRPPRARPGGRRRGRPARWPGGSAGIAGRSPRTSEAPRCRRSRDRRRPPCTPTPRRGTPMRLGGRRRRHRFRSRWRESPGWKPRPWLPGVHFRRLSSCRPPAHHQLGRDQGLPSLVADGFEGVAQQPDDRHHPWRPGGVEPGSPGVRSDLGNGALTFDIGGRHDRRMVPPGHGLPLPPRKVGREEPDLGEPQVGIVPVGVHRGEPALGIGLEDFDAGDGHDGPAGHHRDLESMATLSAQVWTALAVNVQVSLAAIRSRRR